MTETTPTPVVITDQLEEQLSRGRSTEDAIEMMREKAIRDLVAIELLRDDFLRREVEEVFE